MSVRVQGVYVATYSEVNSKIDQAKREMRGQIDRARREAMREAKQIAGQEAERAKREMDAKLRTAINSANDRIRKIDEENRRRIQQTANALNSRMDQIERDLKGDIRTLNTRIDRIVADVNDRFGQQDRRMDDMESDISGLYTYIANEQERARQTVNDAQELYKLYMDKYPIAQFVPQKANEIAMRMRSISGATAADEAKANEIMVQLQLAAEEAEILQRLHLKIAQATNEAISGALKVVHENRTREISDGDDVVEIESNFWSRGQYQQVLDQLKDLKAEMDSDPDNERMIEMQEMAKALDAQAQALAEEAVKKAQLSEDRLKVADDLIQAYVRQGYSVKQKPRSAQYEVGYMGGEIESDWREGVFAILQGPLGEEITVMVNPSETKNGNDILFHRNDERNISEKEYVDSIRVICDIARRAGYEIGEPQAPANCNDKKLPQLSKGDEISRPGAAANIKRSL